MEKTARATPSEQQPPLSLRLASIPIAVVIPAYRVSKHLERVVREIPQFVRYVIVVDDACPQRSGEQIETLLGERIHLLRHEHNQGVGGAMLSGYRKALELGAQVVVKVDGDGQMDPRQLRRLITPVLEGHADYTKGNRFLHFPQLRDMPLARRIGNFGLTFLTKAASGYWGVFDPTNGYTAIHREPLRLIQQRAVAKDYFFETSMLFELRRLGARVLDIAIPARYRKEESSLSLGKALARFPMQLLAGLLRRIGRQYLLHDFNAVSVLIVFGIPLILFGFVWGGFHWYQSVSSGKYASTGTVLLAVLPIIVGVQFLVQALVMDVASAPKEAIHPKIQAGDLVPPSSRSLDAGSD